MKFRLTQKFIIDVMKFTHYRIIFIAVLSLVSIFIIFPIGKKAEVESQQNNIHLNRYYHFTELMRDPFIEVHLLRYRSTFDLTLQSVLIIEPYDKKAERIFFFFHGMDGDCGDGVIVRGLVKGINAKVICMGGRGPSWVSDAFISDATQVINVYLKNYEGYYLIGVSMGGTQALSLAGLLPKKLRQPILGLIALIPGSDLLAIAKSSSNQGVKNTLIASVNGNLSKLKQRSPYYLINKYKMNLPFIIFYNENDSILLSKSLEIFINKLRITHPVSTFTAPGEHNFTYENIDYKKIFEELGKVSIVNKKIPIQN